MNIFHIRSQLWIAWIARIDECLVPARMSYSGVLYMKIASVLHKDATNVLPGFSCGVRLDAD